MTSNSGHMFSMELKSKNYVKNLSLSSDNQEDVLIEGFLGDLKRVGFSDGVMLEIEGTNGVLRVDLSEEELKRLLPKAMTIPVR